MKDHKIIVFIIHALQPGGMERVMAELANYFAVHNNTSVHFIFFGKFTELFYQLHNNIIVHDYKKKFDDKLRILEIIKRLLYVRNTVKQINPDAILSFGIHWNNFVLLSLIGLHYKVFVSDRGSPLRRYSFINRFLRKILYRAASGIIAQTSIAKEETLKVLPFSNITVIGNPIRPIHNLNNTVLKDNIILSVGRLISTKHHDRLIKIFSRLNAPGWKLVIVGGNALKENNYDKLQQKIIDLNLGDTVILEGTQKNVDEYYLKSKIFAFTSSVEGFPNVLGEALSAGLPVVSYNCIAGPSDMIQDGNNGYLVPLFNDDLFLNRLQILIDDEKLRRDMSQNAKESIKVFDIENICSRYYSFLTS